MIYKVVADMVTTMRDVMMAQHWLAGALDFSKAFSHNMLVI